MKCGVLQDQEMKPGELREMRPGVPQVQNVKRGVLQDQVATVDVGVPGVLIEPTGSGRVVQTVVDNSVTRSVKRGRSPKSPSSVKRKCESSVGQ